MGALSWFLELLGNKEEKNEMYNKMCIPEQYLEANKGLSMSKYAHFQY